jgi:hypothetical protein
MSIIAVTEHRTLHTCPAETEPHPVSIQRTVVHVTPGRECTNPITIRIGDTAVTVPCGQREPSDRQCAGCRTTVVTLAITTTDLDQQTPIPGICEEPA